MISPHCYSQLRGKSTNTENMDLGLLLHALIPSSTSVSNSSLKTNLSQIPEIASLIHRFSNHFLFLYTFGSSGCYLSRILYILGHCWTCFTWKSSSRCNLTGRFPSSLSLQWSVYTFMCVWFSEFHFLFFENLVFNFVVYVCVLKGLLSLLLLVALLGMAAKMDYISPTVCVHCFQLFLLFLFSL